MSRVVRIPEKLFKRLEKYAEGFDSPVNVIEKLLNQIEGVEISDTQDNTIEDDNVLPVKFFPKDLNVFKERLIANRKAIITIVYNDGTKEDKLWNAYKFDEESNLIGNIRSRKAFRQGRWRANNIKELLIKIDE